MATWGFKGGLKWFNSGFVENKEVKIDVINELDREFELPDGCLIVPGLVDFHCHVWAPGALVGVTDIEYLSSGVVAVVDAGTFGYDGWANADRLWQNSQIEIRSWLSVLPEGLTLHPNPNPTKPENISMERLLETASLSGQRLYGFKVRLGQRGVENDRGLLTVAREAAEKSGLKMMVHLTDTSLTIDEVLDTLRPGDILTHPYHGKKGNILDAKGKVATCFLDAVEKGLLLDVGQGSKHFSWKVFKQAISEGLKPHFISSDLVRNTWKKPPVDDMSYIVSRFIAGGLSKDEVFSSLLNNATDFMGIKIDPTKNLVVLQPDYSKISYSDSEDILEGNIRYSPVIQIFNGKSIFVADYLSK
ncbi:hypothetical protein [Halalkalibacter alkaliphilus]|uniref:Amidohydrolase-related domain-containing protein n=1 Tax=Halalkalibacter alkaliphilus TaxID=2917993 RepID=A0A9X2CVZ4_9BACI|nr:hypothetical protein [Halalkalibacter alkaliphilus]MCL7748844.1 hypothetical protein [Halalkalibacter alkaliphilus]